MIPDLIEAVLAESRGVVDEVDFGDPDSVGLLESTEVNYKRSREGPIGEGAFQLVSELLSNLGDWALVECPTDEGEEPLIR